MKQNKLATGLSLTILIAFLWVGVALAKTGGATSNNPINNGDPVQTHNTHNKGLKAPHSARKQAAKRLRLAHQQEHQQKLHNWAKAHHGYTGLGQAGDFSQIPANNGGAK